MDISQRTIKALEETITGNTGRTGYRSGPRFVDLFVEFGFNDRYGPGFPSRWDYTQSRINDLNGQDTLRQLVEKIFDPLEFQEGESTLEQAVEEFNKYLRRDGYQVVLVGDRYSVRNLAGNLVDSPDIAASSRINSDFISEQLADCDGKLASNDFDGAITNARTMVEQLLLGIEESVGASSRYDGDIVKLYKRVQKHLQLDPASRSITDSQRQVLGGLHSVLNGLAGVSNEMSDRHAPEFRATEGDARLAVNSAKTLAEFLYYEFGRLYPDQAS